MKRFTYHINFLFLLVSIMGCGKKPGPENNSNSNKENFVQNNIDESLEDERKNKQQQKLNEAGQILSLPDTHYTKVDTSIQIDNYHILFTKEKFDASQKRISADDMEYNPYTVFISKSPGDSVIYKKLFDENQFINTRSFKDKQTHYIILSNFSGGSGYVSTVYKLSLGKSPQFEIVFQYSELTSSLFSSDGSQVLIMQGIWDMRDESDESHFSDHKYEIQTVDLLHPGFKIETIGYTVHKYPSADYDFSAEKLLKQIHQKEPQVFKNLKMDKYLVQ